MNDRIAVFHPGTQHSWQTASALQQLGRLQFYATSIFHQPDRWPYRIERYLPAGLAARVGREFGRFSHPALDPALVHTSGLAEWLERAAYRAGWRRLARRIDEIGNRRFATTLGSRLRSAEPFGLWGYSGSALDAFRIAKDRGRLCILDRTIGDWRVHNRILDSLHDEYAEFFPSSGYRVSQRDIDRDDEEYALADVILTGSRFAAETVRLSAAGRSIAAKLRVLNYCYDERLFASLPPPLPRPRDEPLRFLFLGQAGVRKGIHLVLKAFARIPASAAHLTIVGDLQLPAATWLHYADRADYRHTVPRSEVPALLADHDILLFPSYFEGAGIVLYEALAAGTALIQSRNAALAATEATGLTLDTLDEDTLYAAVMTAIDDRNRVDGWRTAAQTEARRYSFERYRTDIAALLDDLENATRAELAG